jgi:hypothetical protein
MLSRIKDRLGVAGFAVAIIALVAAVAGTAFAALPGLNSKQKKQVTSIAQTQAKKFAQSVPGPAGPQGPKGDTGAKGDTGSKGDQGEPGEDGEDGEDGEPGEDGVCSVSIPECVLPVGATLVGHFSANASKEEEKAFATISTGLQLPSVPEVQRILPPSEGGEPTPECPGTVEEPDAAPGFLCVYIERRHNAQFGQKIADTSGGYVEVLPLVAESDFFFVNGTWAVTPN